MSLHQNTSSDDKAAQVRQLLRRDFSRERADATRQAVHHREGTPYEDLNRHCDGERMVRDFGLTPFVKVLERLDRADDEIVEYPKAFLNSFIHIDDAEKYILEEGDLEYFSDAPRSRRLVMEWLADHPEILSVMGDGGTDVHAHSKPGKGKTSFTNVMGTVRNAEVNNETVVWALTLDELEVLPVAPYMTLLAPEGVRIHAEAQPKDPRFPRVEIGLETVFRDVIRYRDPRHIWELVAPGGVYGVLPDPRFRQCEQITTCAFNTAAEAEEPNEVTPLNHFVFPLLETRAKDDLFLHPTTIHIDEAGDVLGKRPRADASDTYRKVDRYPSVYGKARKKNCSVHLNSHSLGRVHEDVLEKERWFLTLPDTPVPSNKLSGLGQCPVPDSVPHHLEMGQAVIWNQTNYTPISWSNPYRTFEFNGEIAISYPDREAALP